MYTISDLYDLNHTLPVYRVYRSYKSHKSGVISELKILFKL